MVLEQDCAQSWAQSYGDKTGDNGGGRDRDRELLEEQSGDTGDKSGGHENGAQGKRDRDQGATDLVHRLVSCFQRRHAGTQVALYVFDNNDRIIDNNSHRQNQAEKREVVDRDAEHIENGERSDERYRNCNDGDDGGSPVLEEQKHDPEHQKDCHENRDYYLVDRFGDEDRRIVNYLVVGAGRKVFRQLFHSYKDFVVDGK